MAGSKDQKSVWLFDEPVGQREGSRSSSSMNHRSQQQLTKNIPQLGSKENRVTGGRPIFKHCGSCFCYGMILGILIGSIILAVVLTLWLASKTNSQKNISAVSTTTTTSVTSVTSVTSTTSTTTATTTTSTTTSTTATSTTTSSITTSITTTQTTTTGSTSTSTTTVTTTTSDPCLGNPVYSTQLLYLSLSVSLSWTQYSFSYVAPSVNSATIMFIMRNDPDFWYLDDITITNSTGSQLLRNNDFEYGDFTSWTYCNPSNAGSAGQVTSNIPLNGLYSYEDGAVGYSDYLSQNFTVRPGFTYSISFWLMSPATNTAYAKVLINA